MKCINVNCQQDIPDDSIFCNTCGTKQPEQKQCPKCKCKNILSEAFFCPKCGERIDVSQTEAEINEMKLAEVTGQLKKCRENLKTEVKQKEFYEKGLADERAQRESLEKKVSSTEYQLLQWEEKKHKLDQEWKELRQEQDRQEKRAAILQEEREKFEKDRDGLLNNLVVIKEQYTKTLNILRDKEHKIEYYKDAISYWTDLSRYHQKTIIASLIIPVLLIGALGGMVLDEINDHFIAGFIQYSLVSILFFFLLKVAVNKEILKLFGIILGIVTFYCMLWAVAENFEDELAGSILIVFIFFMLVWVITFLIWRRARVH